MASIVCGRPGFGGVVRGSREIYVRHIDVSWAQCYKTISPHEILDRFAPGGLEAEWPERAGQATTAGSGLPCDCRAAFRQNILDFCLPQKHVLGGMLATETGRNKAGGGPA
ncbi:hypothetical protein JJB98_31680 [Bradyrhizobium diazoefficiens]|nr:hypothetical protein [Bradyrhizobium diazoefficiens]QQO24839.1 hypothetical protein JJB98_31680 [Bradyrhizobium diazoefficiens]